MNGAILDDDRDAVRGLDRFRTREAALRPRLPRPRSKGESRPADLVDVTACTRRAFARIATEAAGAPIRVIDPDATATSPHRIPGPR